MSDLAELAAALAAFQAEMPVVAKGKTAKVATKTGPGYSYTYADLADVTEAAMPILSKHGLSFSCMPTLDESGPRLIGMLLHSSGQSLEGSLPIKGNGPQELGGWLTYGRRYLLGCLTGIVTDNDDDGKAAQQAALARTSTSTAQKTRMSRKKPADDEPPPGDEPRPDDSLRTPAQSKMLFALLNKAGLTDRDEVLGWASTVIGRELDSTRNLTVSECSQCIDALNAASTESGD